MSESTRHQSVVAVPMKSVGVSLILTFFFGPLGMLYSTIIGGIIMFVVSVIVSFITLGIGLAITWPICMIWGGYGCTFSQPKALGRANVSGEVF